LIRGDFAGWAKYEWRWQATNKQSFLQQYAVPQWRGEPLAGKTISVACGTGLWRLSFSFAVPVPSNTN